ncbi:metallophosphoesterase [Occultella kanbiaonis]|uniref:metallophosphoesterase n=1 Tax=Occultella kanbiaonis TaxID=2675754 RepID=UPI0012B7E880|nr:metallophosphoesterase [Occultella kanbiaonis]
MSDKPIEPDDERNPSDVNEPNAAAEPDGIGGPDVDSTGPDDAGTANGADGVTVEPPEDDGSVAEASDRSSAGQADRDADPEVEGHVAAGPSDDEASAADGEVSGTDGIDDEASAADGDVPGTDGIDDDASAADGDVPGTDGNDDQASAAADGDIAGTDATDDAAIATGEAAGAGAPMKADGESDSDASAPPARHRFEWWHRQRPRTRRTIRAVVAFVLTGLLSLLAGVMTADFEGSLGPHRADYSVRLNGEVTVDMGPLGALIVDSPLPLNLGVDVLVKEIPIELSTPQTDPVVGLTSDLTSYSQFLANPEAAISDAAYGLVLDVVSRWILYWTVLLVGVALGRLAAHGVLREAVKSAWARQGVPALSVALAVVLVGLPLVEATQTSGGVGRTSRILADTPLAEARITGRLATLVDHYGGYVVDAIDDNTEFYAEVQTNLEAAYAAEADPVAPAEGETPQESPSGESGTEPTNPASDAGAAAAGTDDSGTDDSGTDDSGTDDSGTDDSGTDDSGTDDSGTDDSGTDDSGTDDSGTDDSGTDDSGTDDSGTDDSGTDDSGTDDSGTDDSAVGDSGTDAADTTESDPELVTMLLVSDLHCNVGMAPVVGAAVSASESSLVLNAGDTVMGGTSVESYCVNAFARGIPDGVPVVVSDGNHDSVTTADQEANAGWTVLHGEPVDVQGIRILGDTDPTLTSLGAPTRPERDETINQMGNRISQLACQLQEDDEPVDIVLIHSPFAGRQSVEAGCATLSISGHLHRQVGPRQLGLGLQYTSASTAGAGSGTPTIGPLQNPSVMTVIRWDPEASLPVDYRLITIDPDASVDISDWFAFPEVPETFVTGDAEGNPADE